MQEGGGQELIGVERTAHFIRQQAGSGWGTSRPLSSAGQHPASAEHPCRPQGGALVQPEPTSGPLVARVPQISHPTIPPPQPQQPLAMPRDLPGQAQAPLPPKSARSCKRKLGQHGYHTWATGKNPSLGEARSLDLPPLLESERLPPTLCASRPRQSSFCPQPVHK